MELKKCNDCGEEKPLTEFYKRNDRGSTSYRGDCRVCIKAKQVTWQKKNRDKVNAYHREQRRQKPHQEKNRRLKHRFGITLQDYNNMLREQDNKCLICDIEMTHDSERTRIVVDHCHTTEKVRGLLCSPCNKGLGHFYEDTEIMQRAIDYLLTHSNNRGISIASAAKESDII
tara:strand:- start:44 stop:559 length:516 start_codon:yes stop_codon:yes gene_type:complete